MAVAVVVAIATSGCVNANDVAKKIGAPSEPATKIRAMETRRFDTVDEASMLAAGTQALQDLGFIIAESSVEAGVVTGTKQRDATEAGQVAAQVVVTVVAALFGAYHHPVWDKDQSIHITLVSTPIAGTRKSDVRVSFDRLVRNTDGQVRAELITDPRIYQEFFQKFGNSLALTPQET